MPTVLPDAMDPGSRPNRAVAITLQTSLDGALTLYFDELLQTSDAPRTWIHEVFVTSATVPAGNATELSNHQFEGLGRTIWGCLLSHQPRR